MGSEIVMNVKRNDKQANRTTEDKTSDPAFDENKIAGRLEPRRPPMKDEGTETAFRLDQCKHFRKSKHLFRSEVNRCDQSSIELHLRRSTSTGE